MVFLPGNVLPHSTRLLFCLLLFAGTLYPYASPGQQKVYWEQLNAEYKSKKVNDTTYFKLVDSLIVQAYNDPALREKLMTYREIAWSKEAYFPYRIRYYTYLANNATFTNRTGASIFLLEQREEELKKVKPYFPSLATSRVKYFIYGRNKSSFHKCREEYKKIAGFLQRLPVLMLTDSIPEKTVSNAMAILMGQAALYVEDKDTNRIKAIKQLSEGLLESVRKKRATYPEIDNLLYEHEMITYYMETVRDHAEGQLQALHDAYRIVRESREGANLWKRIAVTGAVRALIDFHLEQNQRDSAAHYLDFLNKKEYNGLAALGDESHYYLARGRLSALNMQYEDAYSSLLTALRMKDSMIAVKMADINNNLYAEAAAIHKEAELRTLEEQTYKRNIITGIISLLIIGLIIALFVLLKRREKRFRRKIEELNHLAQMEIAELETKANMVQKKLGMELHDDIAGRLVYLCNSIEKEILDHTDQRQLQQLQRIRDLARETYLNTREKSHEWYAEGEKEEQKCFYESIRKLAGYALPEEQFKKVIEIDETSLRKVSYKIKIALLRILQEAFVNILRHANATSMELFIYEDEQWLSMQIRDNGKGFDTSRSGKHLGLQSMELRARELGGTLEVLSSKEGTELTVNVPVDSR